MTTHLDVANWMVQQFEKKGSLYQEDVVTEIPKKFGKEFTYINQNGNLAIDREVLKEFRSLTEAEVVWDRSERMWRKREHYDPSSGRSVE